MSETKIGFYWVDVTYDGGYKTRTVAEFCEPANKKEPYWFIIGVMAPIPDSWIRIIAEIEKPSAEAIGEAPTFDA